MESVAAFAWNGWQASSGISGNLGLEYADEDEKKRSFSPEVHLEAAQLVVEQGYTVKAACDAMGVGKSTMEYWVRILRSEHAWLPF